MSDFMGVSKGTSAVVGADKRIPDPDENVTHYALFAHGKTDKTKAFNLNRCPNHIAIAFYCPIGDVAALTDSLVDSFCNRAIIPHEIISNDTDEARCSIVYNMEFTSEPPLLNDLIVCEGKRHRSLLKALKLSIPSVESDTFLSLNEKLIPQLYYYHYEILKKKTRMILHILACRAIDGQPIIGCALHRTASEPSYPYHRIIQKIATEQNGGLMPSLDINIAPRKDAAITSGSKAKPDCIIASTARKESVRVKSVGEKRRVKRPSVRKGGSTRKKRTQKRKSR
jgi:hypothetical protein